MIVNIRGTNGSGKTTIVRDLMAKYATVVPIGENVKKPDGYRCTNSAETDKALYVVGSYNNTCGGCDGIALPDNICSRVKQYAAFGDGHVVFEGIIISRTYERYKDLAQDLCPTPFLFAFLDTPLSVCIERVKTRRLAKGNTKELSLKSLTDTHDRNRKLYNKFIRETMCEARWMVHQTASADIWKWLNSTGTEWYTRE